MLRLACRRSSSILRAMKGRTALGIGLPGAMLVLAVLWFAGRGVPPQAGHVAAPHESPGAAGQAVVSMPYVPGAEPAVAGPARVDAPAAGGPVPPGVTATQWQQLVAEHAGRPDGAVELQRLSEYFHFSAALQQFRQLRKAASSGPELAALAQVLDQGLDARLQRQEVNGAEARAIKAAVLEVQLPDEAARQAALRQWQAAAAPLASSVPRVADTRARDAEFLRLQAAAVAAWSARPAAERDPQALEREIAALKQATYSSPAAPAANPAPFSRRTP